MTDRVPKLEMTNEKILEELDKRRSNGPSEELNDLTELVYQLAVKALVRIGGTWLEMVRADREQAEQDADASSTIMTKLTKERDAAMAEAEKARSEVGALQEQRERTRLRLVRALGLEARDASLATDHLVDRVQEQRTVVMQLEDKIEDARHKLCVTLGIPAESPHGTDWDQLIAQVDRLNTSHAWRMKEYDRQTSQLTRVQSENSDLRRDRDSRQSLHTELFIELGKAVGLDGQQLGWKDLIAAVANSEANVARLTSMLRLTRDELDDLRLNIWNTIESVASALGKADVSAFKAASGDIAASGALLANEVGNLKAACVAAGRQIASIRERPFEFLHGLGYTLGRHNSVTIKAETPDRYTMLVIRSDDFDLPGDGDNYKVVCVGGIVTKNAFGNCGSVAMVVPRPNPPEVVRVVGGPGWDDVDEESESIDTPVDSDAPASCPTVSPPPGVNWTPVKIVDNREFGPEDGRGLDQRPKIPSWMVGPHTDVNRVFTGVNVNDVDITVGGTTYHLRGPVAGWVSDRICAALREPIDDESQRKIEHHLANGGVKVLSMVGPMTGDVAGQPKSPSERLNVAASAIGDIAHALGLSLNAGVPWIENIRAAVIEEIGKLLRDLRISRDSHAEWPRKLAQINAYNNDLLAKIALAVEALTSVTQP